MGTRAGEVLGSKELGKGKGLLCASGSPDLTLSRMGAAPVRCLNAGT